MAQANVDPTVDAAVRAYALNAARHANDACVLLDRFYNCRPLKGMPKKDVRAWLRARPDDYLVVGRSVLVLPALKEAAAPNEANPMPETILKTNEACYKCMICDITISSIGNMRGHLDGLRHHKRLERATPDDIRRALAACANAPSSEKLHTCELCGRWFKDKNGLNNHLVSNPHVIRQYALLMRQANLASANTNNVVISQLPDPIPALEPGASATYYITVTNLSGVTQVLRRVSLLQPVDGVSISHVSLSSGLEFTLPPGAAHHVGIKLSPRFLGLMRGVIVFDFGSFQAVRLLAATCADAETEAAAAAAIAAGASGRRHRRRNLEPLNTDIVPGEAPPGSDNASRSGRLMLPIGSYPVPKDLRSQVEQQRWDEVEKSLRAPAATDGAAGAASAAATVRTYANKLKRLMWLEELQHEVDVRQYDMKGVCLTASGNRLLVLQVPGLAENRPSVLKGDRLYVRPSDGSSGGREWEGCVHVVRREEVLLGFHADFLRGGLWLQGRAFDVRFAVNRSLFNRLQAALSRTATGGLHPLLLLPGSPAAPLPAPPPRDLNPSDPSAANCPPGSAAEGQRIAWANARLNDEQRHAVREVLRGAHHPLPYIIFGPPGTGKTSTLVEAAVQLLRSDPCCRLLLAAPSNSAADQLFQRLLAGGRPPSEMMRVCAFSRPLEDLPPDLASLSGSPQLNWDDGVGAFQMPPLERLTEGRLRVLVTTCATAAMLYHAGVPPGHFSHVCCDEAGHAEEPLLLAALAGLAGPDTRVVLAGDPQQLGPVILSPVARRHGLATSLLERLARGAPYARREAEGQPPYASAYITKLLLNYRSHPDILAVPNAAFYHGELRAALPEEEANSLLHWEKLPNKSCPLLFHNLVGRDMQEANSPSWCNLDEMKMVKQYVTSLMVDLRRNRVKGSEIGVISPYRKQVQRIREQLRAVDAHIKVGSVEEFQGQERRVVVISTVRSSQQHLQLDARHRLGFLGNPKRLNVAVTRAKALLVIVGNAQVLATDRHWRMLLRFIRDRGAFTGQSIPPDLFEEDEAEEADEDEAGDGGGNARGTTAPRGGGGGGSSGSTAAASELAAALQRLVLSNIGDGSGGGGRGAGADVGVGSELDRQLRYFGGALEVEGGEMPRME